jgi:hypothetical protein
MNLSAYVSGVGLLGPGLAGWPAAARVLAADLAHAPGRTLLQTPSLLPPAERRRVGRVVQVALAVAFEAAAGAGIDPASLAAVFSSSGGDGHNCHALCEALAQPEREISPTRFSNSVHNAAAGYWSIATGSMLASTVLCAFDASFCAGLLEALAQVAVADRPVLLVAYDTEYPEPIHATRPVPDAFGVALVLTPRRVPASLARLRAGLGDGTVEAMSNPSLELLRGAIPAARCLPLVQALARGTTGPCVLEYLDSLRLLVELEPCR